MYAAHIFHISLSNLETVLSISVVTDYFECLLSHNSLINCYAMPEKQLLIGPGVWP